jgi:enterochelin esterase-like enzyme
VKPFKFVCRLTALLTIGALSASAVQAHAQDLDVPRLHGQLVLKSMPPSLLLNGRKITTWVYLPPGYDAPENATRRYPVAYLLHGAPGDWTDCYESGHVEEMADSLIQSGQMPPLILVAFEGNGPRGSKDITDFCNRQSDGYRVEDFMSTIWCPI